MTTNHFTSDNTEDYTATQLAKANRIMAGWCYYHNDPRGTGDDDSDYKRACEAALVAVEGTRPMATTTYIPVDVALALEWLADSHEAVRNDVALTSIVDAMERYTMQAQLGSNARFHAIARPAMASAIRRIVEGEV